MPRAVMAFAASGFFALASFSLAQSPTPPPTPPARTNVTPAASDAESIREAWEAWIAQTIKDHEAAIALFTRAASSATDVTVRTLAESKLPALKEHLTRAQALKSEARQAW